MKITILGSGTCVPRLDRSASAVLVESGALKILVDVGPGTLRRLLERDVTIFDLTHILITHFHPDHVAELISLIFATKYSHSERRIAPLTVIGGLGLKKLYHGLQTVFGHWIALPESQLVLRELDTLAGETFSLDGVKVTARPMQHRPESLAYRFDENQGGAFVYSGDTEPCQALIDLARQADLFVCESALPDGYDAPGHLTPSLAGNIARQAQVKRLVLTHLYPPCDDVDIAKQAAGVYKGPVTVARDLMAFDL